MYCVKGHEQPYITAEEHLDRVSEMRWGDKPIRCVDCHEPLIPDNDDIVKNHILSTMQLKNAIHALMRNEEATSER